MHSARLLRTVHMASLRIMLESDTLRHAYIRGSASYINCDLDI